MIFSIVVIVTTLLFIAELSRIERRFKKVMKFLDAYRHYRLAVLYGLIDEDELLSGKDADTVLHEDIYYMFRNNIVKQQEEYDKFMGYYEMLKGLDFNVLQYESELASHRYKYIREMYQARLEYIAHAAPHTTHHNLN